jgi:hypothetical protein
MQQWCIVLSQDFYWKGSVESAPVDVDTYQKMCILDFRMYTYKDAKDKLIGLMQVHDDNTVDFNQYKTCEGVCELMQKWFIGEQSRMFLRIAGAPTLKLPVKSGLLGGILINVKSDEGTYHDVVIVERGSALCIRKTDAKPADKDTSKRVAITLIDKNVDYSKVV